MNMSLRRSRLPLEFASNTRRLAITTSGVACALDQTLTDLMTLDLVVRQARANLAGEHFRNVHLLLDGLADVARGAGRTFAARSIALGHNPDFWAEAGTRKTALQSVGLKPLCDMDALSALATILAAITTRLNANIEASACDLVTQGLLIGLTDRLENIEWTIHARSAA